MADGNLIRWSQHCIVATSTDYDIKPFSLKGPVLPEQYYDRDRGRRKNLYRCIHCPQLFSTYKSLKTHKGEEHAY